ncbi:MAG: septum formation initiator family protein [Prevotellaceae bacterium]|jgi:cell division protein FtsB|nr:septum formation initiator family protein [Prevotellaceae bacterium]
MNPHVPYVLGKLKNKYIITLVLFIAWVAIFDQNNLIERFSLSRQAGQLEAEKAYYEQVVEQNKDRLLELKTNDANLEKYAREQYLMKHPDEDIFLIVEE